MVTKIGTLDDLMQLPQGTEILMIRKNPGAKGSSGVDNFFVHGRFHSVDERIWVNIDDSIRIPLAQVLSRAGYEVSPDFSSIGTEELLQFLKAHPDLPCEKSTASYRLRGFQDPIRGFPGPNYEIYNLSNNL